MIEASTYSVTNNTVVSLTSVVDILAYLADLIISEEVSLTSNVMPYRIGLEALPPVVDTVSETPCITRHNAVKASITLEQIIFSKFINTAGLKKKII